MGTIPFALSVHSFINSVGADAGFASIIGLAILVLLYFAQARETATLRDRLDEAAERAAGLEQRIAQLMHLTRTQAQAQPPVAPPPVGARPLGAVSPVRRVGTAPAAVGAGPATAGARAGVLPGPLPSAPAGVGAPALSSATRLIPTPAAMPALATTVATPAAPAPAAVPAGVPADLAASAADDTVLVAPAPITVAAGGNGHSQTLPPVAPPRFDTRFGGSGGSGGSGGTGTIPPTAPPRVQIRPDGEPGPAPRRPIAPSRPAATRDPTLGRRLIVALITLGAIAIVVVALLVITSSPSTTKTAVKHPSVTAKHHHGKAKAVASTAPASVDVAVLNGTAVGGLAADVGSQLSTAGYKVPNATITNATAQTHTSTIVGYTTGHQADALEVAKALQLKPSNVGPVDQDALGVACPQDTAANCTADVIVTIGSDLAGDANSSTSSTTTP